MSSLSSVNAIRVTPAVSMPTATSINPDASENQPQTETVRAVNETEKTENTRTDQTRQTNNRAAIVAELDPAEKRVLDKLKSRDREVRAHEQAHLSAAGNLATSSASFTYQRGPDGQRYAVGGEVGIDSARVTGDPAATIQRAQQIRRAALAPATPSAQDRSVAVNASATALKAQAELAELNQSERGQSAVNAFNNIVVNDSKNKDEENKPVEIDTFA